MPLGKEPTVLTVTFKALIWHAAGSDNTPMASSTASKLAIGSPMPWKTTPWMRPGVAVAAKSRRTVRTCSTISQAAKLRSKPSLPVAQ